MMLPACLPAPLTGPAPQALNSSRNEGYIYPGPLGIAEFDNFDIDCTTPVLGLVSMELWN